MTVEKWERRCEVPLILLALAFLVAEAWPVLNTRLDQGHAHQPRPFVVDRVGRLTIDLLCQTALPSSARLGRPTRLVL